MKKPNIPKALTSLRMSAQKHSPEILTGIGIAGMIVTTVMAVRATPKALILIDNKKEKLKEDKLAPIETVKTVGVCYIPAAITGTISIACLIGASSVNLRRRAALVTAYTLSESALKEYREKVVETIGPKKEQSIKDEIAKDKIQKNPVSNKEVILIDKGNTLCFDTLSGRYFKSDKDKIDKAVNELNRRMRDEMYISLNDFYYEIGLSGISLGDMLGWNIDNGYIEPNFSYQGADDGTPCMAISYLVEPRYNYF